MVDYIKTGDQALLGNLSLAEAVSIEDEFKRRELHSYRWADPAEMAAQSGMRDGDEGYVISTDRFYTRRSGVWEWQELRTDRGPLFGDSVLTYPAGVTPFDDIGSAIYVKGPWVLFRVDVSASIPHDTSVLVNTIVDTALRPAAQVASNVNSEAGHPCGVYIQDDGTVEVRQRSGSTRSWAAGVIMYPRNW